MLGGAGASSARALSLSLAARTVCVITVCAITVCGITVCGITGSAPAADGLVPAGASWKYTTATDPGPQWRAPDYDDSLWSRGRAPFSDTGGAGSTPFSDAGGEPGGGSDVASGGGSAAEEGKGWIRCPT